MSFDRKSHSQVLARSLGLDRQDKRKLFGFEQLESRRLLAGNGPPNVLSVTRVEGNPTNLASLSYQILFDEVVQASTVDVADFALAKTGAITGQSIASVLSSAGAGSNSDKFFVSINSGSGSGTLRLDVIDSGSATAIRDLSNARLGGNGNTDGNFTFGETYTVDKIVPFAVSLNRSDVTPNPGPTVQYAMLFTESVTGVDAGDFQLLGMAGATIASVSGSGSSYTITVSTGSNQGSLQLRLLDNDTIIDQAGNRLGGNGLGNGQFDGQSYTIDQLPRVASVVASGSAVTNANSVTFVVTFSEPVTGVDGSAFQLSTSGGLTGLSVGQVSGAGAVWNVQVATGVGDGQLGLNVSSPTILDSTGQGLQQSFSSGPLVTIDRTPPTLVSYIPIDFTYTSAATVRFQFDFSEPVTGLDANDFEVVQSESLTGALVQNVVATAQPHRWTVTLSTGGGSGALFVRLTTSATFEDLASNQGTASNPGGQGYIIDRAPPRIANVTQLDPNPTALNIVRYLIEFSESVSGVTAASFSAITTGLTGASVQAVQGTGSQYTVVLSTGSGDGTLKLGYTLNVQDAAGNAAQLSDTSSAIYSVDRTAPVVLSHFLETAGPTGQVEVFFDITFSDYIVGLDIGDFLLTTTGVAGASISSVSSPVGVAMRILINTGSGDGQLSVALRDDDSITDLAKNALGGAGVGNGNYSIGTILIKKSVELNGLVWQDANANGVVDSGESVQAGASVYVDSNNNGQFDVGEPNQLTSADGRFSIVGLVAGNHTVRAVPPFNQQQTFPARGGPNRLTLRSTVSSDSTPTLNGPRALAIAPNGTFAYTVSYDLNSIQVLRIDAASGQLQSVGQVAGQSSIEQLRVSPDGKHLYAARRSDTTIQVFSIDSTTGLLSQLQTATSALSSFLQALTISTDGSLVVAANSRLNIGGGGVQVFTRNNLTGLLTISASLSFLSELYDVEISADNRFIYLGDWGRGTIYVVERNLSTGGLTLLQTLPQAGATTGTPAFYQVFSIRLSPDNNQLYATTGSRVHVLNRQANGTLALAQILSHGDEGLQLLGSRSIELSPDGSKAYVVSESSQNLTVFNRDSVNGQLSYFEQQQEDQTGITSLARPWEVVVSSNGKHVLVSAYDDDAVNLFENGYGLPVPQPYSISVAAGATRSNLRFGMTDQPPAALTIAPLSPNPTAAATAEFHVLFSKPVVGVDVSDFALDSTVSGSGLASVTGGPMEYVVRTATGTGSGSITLVLNDDDSIRDANNQPLGGSGSAASVARSTPSLVVDRTPPAVLDMQPLDPLVSSATTVRYRVVFSEPVGAVELADFQAATTGTLSGVSVQSVVALSSTNYLVTLATGTGNGNLGLRLLDDDSITDTLGSRLGGTGVGNGTYQALTNYSFERLPESSLSGVKWNDLNGNGVRDGGEPGLAGWTIFIDSNSNGSLDVGEANTTTVADGSYTFNGLFSGPYLLGEIPQVGWEQTSPGANTFPIQRINLTSSGEQVSGASDKPSLSADGRLIAFTSSGILTPGDTSTQDIFVFDSLNNTVEKISVGIAGALANNFSAEPAISADGRYVAYQSYATNLVANDTNARADIFVYDRHLQTTVNITFGGNFDSSNPTISNDGRFVAFESSASNLVSSDTNSFSDIFLWDRSTPSVRIISINGPTQSNGISNLPVISGDGRKIAYQSTASNLVASDTNSSSDIFVHETLSGQTSLVSRSTSGVLSNSGSFDAAIDNSGQNVAFWSNANNLITGDTNGSTDTFVVNLTTNATEAVSRNNSGALTGRSSQPPSITADGRYVVFTTNSIEPNSPTASSVYVRDRATGQTRRISQGTAGSSPNSNSYYAAISASGNRVAFGSDARNLAAGDTNFGRDVFLVENQPWQPYSQLAVVLASQNLANVDFGDQLSVGDLRGITWQDVSRNGTRQTATEPGIQGRTVYVDSNQDGQLSVGEIRSVTDALGGFQLTGLGAGSHDVREVVPANWTEYSPLDGKHTLRVGQARDVTLDFEGITANLTTTITQQGFSLTTSSTNSLQWKIYTPITTPATPTVQVVSMVPSAVTTLQRTDSQPFVMQSIDLRQFLTNASTYQVNFLGERVDGSTILQSVPIGNSLTTYSLSGFNNLRSLQWFTNGTRDVAFDNVRLQTTDWDYSGLDFGSMGNPGSITGQVFYDLNQNGTREATENFRNNQLVYLDLNNNNFRENNEPQVLTDSAGSFNFSSINAGQYYLRTALPSNWAQTSPSGAHLVDLQPGQTAGGFLFGVWAVSAKVQGIKFHDLNNNGFRDADEPGLAGWTIYIDTDQDGQLDAGEPSTVTRADDSGTVGNELGTYEMAGLIPDNYQIREVAQAGWIQTSPTLTSLTVERTVSSTPTSLELSDDGRFVVFQSTVAFLASDNNGVADIYLFDRQSDTYELISIGLAGAAANATSAEPVVSSDGRFVAFRTLASNIYSGDVNSGEDLIVRDRLLGTNSVLVMPTRVSARLSNLSMTSDGSQVSFTTSANLLPDDTADSIDGYVFHQATGTAERLTGLGGAGNVAGNDLSESGAYFVFDSTLAALVSGDTNNSRDVFLRNRQTGTIVAVSRTASGVWGNGASSAPSVSADGRFVTFGSAATNLVNTTSQADENIYLKDMLTGSVTLVSQGYTGAPAGSSNSPEISADGRWIVFLSNSQTIMPDSANSFTNVYLYDRLSGAISRLSQSPTGVKGTAASSEANISRDGKVISFATNATNIHPSGSGVITLDRIAVTGSNAALNVSLAAASTLTGADFGNRSVPTDVVLNSSSILEKSAANTLVGLLSAINASPTEQHQFAFVSGTGDQDNGSFSIVGNQLSATTSLDYQVKNTYFIRVRATDSAGRTLEKPLTISVLNLPEFQSAVQMGDGTSQRSNVDRIMLKFDGPIDIVAGAFAISKRTRDAQGQLLLSPVDIAWASEPISGGVSVTLRFTGAHTRSTGNVGAQRSLEDGYYQLSIDSSKILSAGTSIQLDGNSDGQAGGNYLLGTLEADNFFSLYGDTNGDGVVGIAEFGQFRSSFGKTAGDAGFNALFDYEGDGAVGISDFGQFRSRFGKPKTAF